MERNNNREEEQDGLNANSFKFTDEDLNIENLIRSYEKVESDLVLFDRVEDDRLYLGFTTAELDDVLKALERHFPEDDLTNRFTAISLGFQKFKRRKKWRNNKR